MPPQTLDLTRKIGQIAIEAGVNGAGDMTVQIFTLTLGGIGKIEAAIDDKYTVRRKSGETLCIDQRGL
jgi:hypothetical protein